MKTTHSTDGFSRRDTMRLMGAAGLLSVFGFGVARGDEPAPAAAAAAMKIANAGFYRFNLGDVEVTILSDGFFAFSPPYPLFGANASKEAVEKALAEKFIPYDGVTAHVHAMLVKTPKDTVLVDTGCGNAFGPTTGKMLANLAAAGVKPTDVNAVILTHAHVDHFSGLLGADGKPVFTNAQFIVSKTEQDFWTGKPDLSKSGIPVEQHGGFIAGAQKVLGALKWTPIEGEKEAVARIRIVPAPGHTPGHATLVIDGGGANQLTYITDAIHHYAISFPHPEYFMGFDTDRELAVETRKKVLDRAAADKTLVAGSHLPFPAVGRVKKIGDAFEWVPAVWQW